MDRSPVVLLLAGGAWLRLEARALPPRVGSADRRPEGRRDERAVPALALRDVRKNFGATEIIRGVTLDIARRRAPRDHRPERRRQDHAVQPDQRPLPDHLGRDPAERRRASTRCRRTGSTGWACRAASRSPRSFTRLSVFENLRCALLWSRGYRYSFWRLLRRQQRAERGSRPSAGRPQPRARAATLPAGLLSYAEQRALEIGMTIAGGASVILLDEPTAGMSNSETDYADGADPPRDRRARRW